MELARRASAKVIYQGVDITADISEDLVSVTYVDALDEADRAEIKAKDREKKWLLSWKPKKGDSLALALRTSDWNAQGDNGSLDCGTFTVDQVRYNGKPTQLTLGGVSTPTERTFTESKQSKTWEQATFSQIADSIKPEGFALDFRSSEDPYIEYMEQKEQTNSEFVCEIARKYGFRIKLYKQKLVLINAAEMESEAPSFTLTEDMLEAWDLDDELTRAMYDGCTVQYKHPKTEEELEFTFIAPGSSGEKIYESTQAVSSVADAERVAKAELRAQNQGGTTCSFDLMGDTDIFAGQICALAGFGDFDGNYCIDTVEHTKSGVYMTRITVHRCLEGY